MVLEKLFILVNKKRKLSFFKIYSKMNVQEEIKLRGEFAYANAIIKAAKDILVNPEFTPEQKIEICLDILSKSLAEQFKCV
jgi:hypothetical protein